MAALSVSDSETVGGMQQKRNSFYMSTSLKLMEGVEMT